MFLEKKLEDNPPNADLQGLPVQTLEVRKRREQKEELSIPIFLKIIKKLVMIAKIIKIILNAILFFMIILGGLVFLSSVVFSENIRVFVVKSGSMEPAIKTGSLIFTQKKEDYQVGDIVTRKTDDPKTTVTHRVVERFEKEGKVFFKTKGDANNAQDSEEVQRKHCGKVF